MENPIQASTEVIRELIVPTELEAPVKQDSDRSPTKTERDVTLNHLSKADAAAGQGEVVRQLVVPPVQAVVAKDGDRSPTKTERGLDLGEL